MILNIELNEQEAASIAEFFKRICLSDYQSKAQTLDEAYLMQDAGEKIRKALSDSGFSMR